MWLASHCRIGFENTNLPNPTLGTSLPRPLAEEQQTYKGTNGHHYEGYIRVRQLRVEHSHRLRGILAGCGAPVRCHHHYRNEEKCRSPHDQSEHTNGGSAQKDANRLGLNRNVGFTQLLSKVGGHGGMRAEVIDAWAVQRQDAARRGRHGGLPSGVKMTFVTPRG